MLAEAMPAEARRRGRRVEACIAAGEGSKRKSGDCVFAVLV